MGAKEYTTAVDMWSVGCIFAELLLNEPLFQAKSELDLISMLFKFLGPPTPTSWPQYETLPLSKSLALPAYHPPMYQQRFPHLSAAGIDLMSSLFTYDQDRRITAEQALKHPYFSESPQPKHPDLFVSFPSIAAGERRRKPFDSPSAPQRFADYKLINDFDM